MKKIIIFTQKDFIFTYKILNSIINKFENYEVYLKFGKTSLFRKIKILLCLFLFSNIKELISLIRIEKLSNKFKFINEEKNEKFEFGLIINYPMKILAKDYNIFNFHLGNLDNQRGSFIFFYKFKKKWDQISLTFHKITDELDKGLIINEKKITCTSMSSFQILNLYISNIDFINKSIDMIINNNYTFSNVTDSKEICKQPTFIEIIKEKFNLS